MKRRRALARSGNVTAALNASIYPASTHQSDRSPVREDDVLAGARKGERQAQEQLFRMHADRAYATAQRYLGSRYDASDVVHDAFLRAFDRIDQFDSNKGAFGSWLGRIVANEALTWLRRERLRYTSDIEEPRVESTKIIGNSPDAHTEYQDLLRALSILPSGARTVLNLAVFEGYSHDEIGEALGITPSASRAQLSRARQQMRQYLSPIMPKR